MGEIAPVDFYIIDQDLVGFLFIIPSEDSRVGFGRALVHPPIASGHAVNCQNLKEGGNRK